MKRIGHRVRTTVPMVLTAGLLAACGQDSSINESAPPGERRLAELGYPVGTGIYAETPIGTRVVVYGAY